MPKNMPSPAIKSTHDGDGVLLVGHGTRDATGVAEFMATAARVVEHLGDVTLEPCFLEIAEPSIPAALDRLVQRGARQITVMPVLLFAAGHAKRDIPEALSQAAADYPGVTWRQTAHLGCHEAILELSALRYRECIQAATPTAPEETLLVLVGRGSHDPEATDEMHRFADLRARLTPVAAVETCFAAMAEPSLEAMLAKVSASPCPRIVVQPHLLFDGLLRSGIKDMVAEAASADPRHEYLVTDHLGPDVRLVTAIVERINQIPGASTSARPTEHPRT